MGTLECVFSVCLGVCTCVCVGGGGQAGGVPARSVFQRPEKLYLRPALPILLPQVCRSNKPHTSWPFPFAVQPAVWLLTFDLRDGVAVSGPRMLNAAVSSESSHRSRWCCYRLLLWTRAFKCSRKSDLCCGNWQRQHLIRHNGIKLIGSSGKRSFSSLFDTVT